MYSGRFSSLPIATPCRRRTEYAIDIGAHGVELLAEHIVALDRITPELHVVARDHPADVPDVCAEARLAVPHVAVDAGGATEDDLVEEARRNRVEPTSGVRRGAGRSLESCLRRAEACLQRRGIGGKLIVLQRVLVLFAQVGYRDAVRREIRIDEQIERLRLRQGADLESSLIRPGRHSHPCGVLDVPDEAIESGARGLASDRRAY